MFLSFLSTNMNWIINGLGLIIIILLIGNYISLLSNRSQIEEATNRKVTNTFMNKKTMETHDEEAAGAVTPDTIRLYEKKFNGVCSFYNAISQMIPIFPLFGILGTVAGLISLMKTEGVEAMTGSLDVALYSTFWGLIWTIGLKFFVAIGPSKAIQDTEIILDDYDKKVNNSYMQGNIVD